MTLTQANALNRLSGGAYTEHLDAIAKNVCNLRVKRGWSREELSRQTNNEVTGSYIAMIESGEQNVSLEKLTHIAGALGTTVQGLLKRRK